jgi:hypothetical protein
LYAIAMHVGAKVGIKSQLGKIFLRGCSYGAVVIGAETAMARNAKIAVMRVENDIVAERKKRRQ